MKVLNIAPSAAVILSMISAGITPANASNLTRLAYYRHLQGLNMVKLPAASPADQSGTYDQTLDHFTPTDKRTFKQRYAIFNDYVSSDSVAKAPVIYYQCGEGNCLDGGGAVPSAVAYYAQSLGAVVVILEHRYYGQSQPFATMTGQDLQYLTYEQALEDFAQFQKYATQQFGLQGKWIFAGGSYSGALSAYYRLKHPELVVGSLSSSGVVRTELNYEDYDRVVATSLSPQCLAAVQDITHQVEEAVTNPTLMEQYKTKLQSTDVKDPLDVLQVVANMVDSAVQYGMQAQFCDTILAAPDPMTAYGNVGTGILQELGQTPLTSTVEGIVSTNASDYTGEVGLRQWQYQSCREFGGFATPNRDPKLSAESKLLDLNYNMKACETLFGISTPPDTDQMNKTYYEPLLDPNQASHILYANGAEDPYMPLSVTKENGNDTNPNTVAVTLPGGSHCGDLSYDPSESAPLAAVHAQFLQLAKSWLGD